MGWKGKRCGCIGEFVPAHLGRTSADTAFGGWPTLPASESVGQLAARNPFNPRPLISHLTNSNESGNLYLKVPLIVSPFRPSFPPQLSVFSQPFDSCRPFCFHNDTNPFSRNSLVFTSMQNPRGVTLRIMIFTSNSPPSHGLQVLSLPHIFYPKRSREVENAPVTLLLATDPKKQKWG
jgi:hypothetical protein